jgi:hypothetical protein
MARILFPVVGRWRRGLRGGISHRQRLTFIYESVIRFANQTLDRGYKEAL